MSSPPAISRYLPLLSADAVPALAAALEGSSGDMHVALRRDLSRRLRAMREDAG